MAARIRSTGEAPPFAVELNGVEIARTTRREVALALVRRVNEPVPVRALRAKGEQVAAPAPAPVSAPG